MLVAIPEVPETSTTTLTTLTTTTASTTTTYPLPPPPTTTPAALLPLTTITTTTTTPPNHHHHNNNNTNNNNLLLHHQLQQQQHHHHHYLKTQFEGGGRGGDEEGGGEKITMIKDKWKREQEMNSTPKEEPRTNTVMIKEERELEEMEEIVEEEEEEEKNLELMGEQEDGGEEIEDKDDGVEKKEMMMMMMKDGGDDDVDDEEEEIKDNDKIKRRRRKRSNSSGSLVSESSTTCCSNVRAPLERHNSHNSFPSPKTNLLISDLKTEQPPPPPPPNNTTTTEAMMMMMPPSSFAIPKSRNHNNRRTPPTPPAHSPSPPSVATTSPPPPLPLPPSHPPLLFSNSSSSLLSLSPRFVLHKSPISSSDPYLVSSPPLSSADKLPSSHVMEINTAYVTPLLKTEVRSPPLGSPHLPPCTSTTTTPITTTNTTNTSNTSASSTPSTPAAADLTTDNMAADTAIPDSSFQERILQLKQQQEIQRQFLLHQYQQKQQQLAEQHEKQIQQQIKLQQNLLYHQFHQEHQRLLELQENELHTHLKQNQRAEEERIQKQRKEEEKLEAIKKKDKSEQSAVASHEVKQRLQEVILKKQREAAAGGGPGTSGVGGTGAGGAAGGSTTLRNWPPGSDFPLRKTASEPNICFKARHKTRIVTEGRPSPLGRRKDKLPGSLNKRRPPFTPVESGSTPDSGQSSPPNGLPASRSSSGSTPIHEEGGGSPYGGHGGGGQGSCSDLTVYSSLPNISMGRPPHSTQPEGLKLPMVSEADMRAALTAGVGPLTGHVLNSTLPYYHPTLPVIDGEGYSSGVTAMDTSPGAGGIMRGGIYHPTPPHITDQQVRPSRSLPQRPLSRTYSSPLPLGHPVLQAQPHHSTTPHHHHPSHHPTHPHAPPPHQPTLDHHLLKQHIRQTVLIRSGSKNHVENVAEETEAAVAQANAPEVIDLTERKMDESMLARQQRSLILQQQRDLLLSGNPPPLHSAKNSAFTPRSGSHIARPLSRAFSSPLVTLSPQGSPQEPININKQGCTTGFAYDNVMLKHQCVCGNNSDHPEHGGRLQSIMARLQETGLIHRCHRLRPRKATLEEIQSCHSEAHTLLFGTSPWNRQRLDMSKFSELPIKSFVRLQCGGIGVDLDTIWNELHTSSAAKMAAGCVIDLSYKVATGELRNGFALVRPPGHHAEHQQAMGFCFFNSIAIAARQLHHKLNLDKILIVDWDVHHGNGTQSMFYDDPHILYVSIHRYDTGSFFPGTGAPTEVGEGDGYGFNINIAFSGGLNPPMGDAEYLAAFRSIVMPIAKDFDPDIVLVSAGFDAADGHPSPLGGYKVTPGCFAYMTKQLMTLARGKVVLALEGGYNLTSICDATEACVRALTGDDLPPLLEHEAARPPCQNACDTLQNVISVQSSHWPVVRRHSGMMALSHLEAQGREDEQETVSAMASLRVDPRNTQSRSPEPSPQQGPTPDTTQDEEEPMEEDSEVK